MSDATVPTVPGGWLLGSARDLQRDQLATYEAAMHTHGDHVRFRVGPPLVGFVFDVVFRPEGAREVLGARDDVYSKDAPVYDEFAHLFGRGLGSSGGERWLRHRRMLQPLFTRQHVEQSLGAVVTAGRELVAGWDVASSGEVVDLAEPSMRYSLRALGRAIFGEDHLESAWPPLARTLPVLSEHAARRGLAPVRVPHSWPTRANRRAEQARSELHGLVDDLVEDRRSRPSAGDDLLGLLLEARDPETGAGLDDDAIRDEVLIFLSAGHETTGRALALALHRLARHDGVQRRVREEVDGTLGSREPTVEDIGQLQYTTQVIDETLRLYPPLHTLVRRSVEGGQLLGHELPPGRVVAVSVWGLHRNPDVWPDPDRFDPSRFDPDRDHDHHAHIPFGAGPRSCIGGHLAMAELVVAVAGVVRAFRLDAPDEEPDLQAGVTLGPAGSLTCRLEPLADPAGR